MPDVLKGLSYEIDFENVDENGQILSLTRAAAQWNRSGISAGGS